MCRDREGGLLPQLHAAEDWAVDRRRLADGRAVHVTLLRAGTAASYAEVLARWQDDAAFRAFFIALLADCPYEAFRWETPPITWDTAGRPFEFVLLDSPELIKVPDAGAFEEHFLAAGEHEVIEFSNLGSDAHMVVPCPIGSHLAYAHVGDFVRRAPADQVHALWARVGAAMQRRIGDRPVWLSTAGAGVAWLHVRLDDRPKYYAHRPYRAAP